MNQEQIIEEMEAVTEYNSSWLGIDFCWLTLENVANSSPSSSALTNWIVSLALDQFMLFSQKRVGANLFCQSDGGQKGQEVRLFAMFYPNNKTDTSDGTICQFWADLTFAGKKSLEVADAVKHSIHKFALPTTRLHGLTANSGSGMPELFANAACKKRDIWGTRATEDSCGLHDLQSVFRYAIQLLHTFFLSIKNSKEDGAKQQRRSGRKQPKETKSCLTTSWMPTKKYR
jgi:hypothetical protein